MKGKSKTGASKTGTGQTAAGKRDITQAGAKRTETGLEGLKRRMTIEASEGEDTGDTLHKQFQESAKTARTFARNMAGGDKVKLLQAFQVAFNMAAGAQVTHPEERSIVRRMVRSESTLAPQRFFSDPVYVDNAVELIQGKMRIVGGVPTTANEFPDCVAVGNNSMWCCTGTLIAANVVVTAGHCGGSCSSRIFIGPNVKKPGTVVKVLKAVRHPDFHQGDNDRLFNDLTVLILKRDVNEIATRDVAPGALVDAATTVLAVGYGNNDLQSTKGYGIKRKVEVPVASASCSTSDAQSKYGCITGMELVAGAPLLNKDSCNGDSGGPVYIRTEDKSDWYLAGATSRGVLGSVNPCGDGGIYVRIDKYMDWIRSIPGGHWS